MKQYIGVDIGGTKCEVAVGVAHDDSMSITESVRFETEGKDAATAEITRLCRRYARDYDIACCGISCGGPLDTSRGLILSPPNLPGWDEVPITELVSSAASRPAYLRNDADACALAESRFGAGRGFDSMVFLTFGTGMGAGIIINGRLYEGACSAAGEIGHIRMENDGPVGYGKAGSFEGFCSGGGIAQLAKIYGGGDITAAQAAQLARDGDRQMRAVYDTCAEYLGRGLAVLVDILNPQAIILGSIYTYDAELIQKRMMLTLSREALPRSLSAVKILPAALGRQVGIIAALTVAYDNEANIK